MKQHSNCEFVTSLLPSHLNSVLYGKDPDKILNKWDSNFIIKDYNETVGDRKIVKEDFLYCACFFCN